MWRRYYHVTHRDNVAAIIESGLDPFKAHGKMKVVWLCSVSRLSWAIAHVSLRHSWAIDKIRVLSVHTDPRNVNGWRWRGIYVSPYVLDVYGLGYASKIINSGPVVTKLEEK